MPAEFINEIEIFIKKRPELGYSSMSEFAKAAIREYMKICQDFKKREKTKG